VRGTARRLDNQTFVCRGLAHGPGQTAIRSEDPRPTRDLVLDVAERRFAERQEIKVFVVASGADAEALREFASARLARFQVPRLWEFRESLPETATQRVENHKLRAAEDRRRPLLG
jgi:acyl-CoA synthetase (AMP-forming)/AMP-acid ligase II